MIAIIALVVLFVSLLQSDQRKLRQFGILSALLYIVAYYDDVIIITTNVIIITLHCKYLTKTCNKITE